MAADQEVRLKYRDEFRSIHGEAFQHWFEKIAVALHGDDCFLAIRVTRGDGGLDGLVLKEGRVYQLHAPPSLGTDSSTATKVRDDFDKAKGTVGSSLKAWTFLHNSADGKVGHLTAQALVELRNDNPTVDIEAIGIDGLWERIEKLPGKKLAALFGISKAVPVPRPPTVPREIPPPPADFTGRETDVAEMLADLDQAGGVAVAGLRGMGGSGKTVIAERVAQLLAPRFPDGQLYLNLKGVGDAPVSAFEAQTHVIRAFSQTTQIPENPEVVKGFYLSLLNGKKVLLLADNAADAAQITPLMPPPLCALIVTSRHNFAAPGLILRNLGELSADQARDMLLKIEPRIGDRAAEIADLCGRLPLALRAAASLLKVTPGLSPRGYATRLQDERNRLRELPAQGGDISVQASFELSYQ
ncbi:MAG: hypothetical protein ACREDR_31420, partial [Blastocatellia bacterium]